MKPNVRSSSARQLQPEQAVREAAGRGHDDRVGDDRARGVAQQRPPTGRADRAARQLEQHGDQAEGQHVQCDDQERRHSAPIAVQPEQQRQREQHPVREGAAEALDDALGEAQPEERAGDQRAEQKHQDLAGKIGEQERPFGDLAQLALRHQPEQKRRQREVEDEGCEPLDRGLAEDARATGEIAQEDDREQRHDRIEDGAHAAGRGAGPGCNCNLFDAIV